MSAAHDANDGAEAMVCCSLDGLAPKMKERVTAAIWECHDIGLDVMLYETTRTQELQEKY